MSMKAEKAAASTDLAPATNSGKVIDLRSINTKMKKRKTTPVEFDFGGEIGVQTIHVGSISYDLREQIFYTRKINNAGEVDMALVQAVNAQLVAEALCDEDGVTLLTVADVRAWQDPEAVDRLSTVILKTVPLGLPIPKDDEPDPSKATK